MDEKALASIDCSRGDGGTLFVQGTHAYKAEEPIGIPSLVMVAEHYGRIVRLIAAKYSGAAGDRYPEQFHRQGGSV